MRQANCDLATAGAYEAPLFLTSRRACDQLGYSRPDSLLRAWRSVGLPVYRSLSGRNFVSVADVRRFVRKS